MAQQNTTRFEVAIVDCPSIDREALTRFLRLELSTEVAVISVRALGPVDNARVQVTCSGRNVWLNVRPPTPTEKTLQAFRTLPERALSERGGERLLALAIAEMLVANAVEHHLAPPPAPPGPPAAAQAPTRKSPKPADQPASPASTEMGASPPPDPAQQTAKPERNPIAPPPRAGSPSLGLRLSAIAVTVPVQLGPTWFGGRIWASTFFTPSIAVEVAGGYMLGTQQSEPGAIHSDVSSAHLMLRYLVEFDHTRMDVGIGGMLSYMHFDGTPSQPSDSTLEPGYVVRERGFVNGGPSVQLRVATRANPLFAGLSVEAAVLLQPVKMLSKPERLVSNIRGLWLGLSVDMGGVL